MKLPAVSVAVASCSEIWRGDEGACPRAYVELRLACGHTTARWHRVESDGTFSAPTRAACEQCRLLSDAERAMLVGPNRLAGRTIARVVLRTHLDGSISSPSIEFTDGSSLTCRAIRTTASAHGICDHGVRLAWTPRPPPPRPRRSKR